MNAKRIIYSLFIIFLFLTAVLSTATPSVARSGAFGDRIAEASEAAADDSEAAEDTASSIEPVSGEDKLLKVYTSKNNGNGTVEFFADNLNHCSYQLQVRFTKLANADTSVPMPFYGKVPVGSKGLKLFTLTPQKGMRYEYYYNYNYYMGFPDDAEHDDGHAYVLPFEAGKRFRVMQGYNGKFSHEGWIAYSIDFDMPQGTVICAARGGVVTAVKSDSNVGGPDKKFKKLGNYIVVFHDDGTNSQYVHLKYGGSFVKVGDRVKAGQPIGLSGNTGWSTDPHLHFMVLKPVKMGFQSIPVKFSAEGGDPVELRYGKTYGNEE